MSGVIAPRAVAGSASGWQLFDVYPLTVCTPAAAGGTCRITLDMLGSDETWLIDHAALLCSSSTQTTFRLYDGDPSDRTFLDGSDAGNFDIAEWPNGLQIGPGRGLVAVWQQATDGAIGTLRLQLRTLKRR